MNCYMIDIDVRDLEVLRHVYTSATNTVTATAGASHDAGVMGAAFCCSALRDDCRSGHMQCSLYHSRQENANYWYNSLNSQQGVYLAGFVPASLEVKK